MSQPLTFRQPFGATLPLRQKLALMYVLMLSMFLVALDQSIVATAIPHIVADLGGFSLLPWVFTLYVLTSTVIIPPIGKLTDMFGRKKFIIPGVAIFVLSSAACGFAPSMAWLILARGVQGIGGGVIIACVFAVLGDLFTPVERAKYFPLFIGMFTFAGLIGPVFGGFLTDGPGWRWCFYINLPVGVLATGFLLLRLPAGGGSGGRLSDVDFLGSFLLTIASSALLLAVAWSQQVFGWTAAPTLGLLGTTVAFSALFVLQERRHPQAIIPLSLFRNVTYVQSILIVLCAASMIFSAGQFLPTYVQIALGASARMSGLITAPQGLGVFVSGLLSGQLIARTGRYKYQMIAGSFGLVVVSALVRRVDASTVQWHLAALLILMGLCAGFVMPLTQVLTQGAVSQAEQGVAASTRQFFQQIAQVMGLALLGLVFTGSYTSGFERSSAPFASSVPPAAYAQFHDEPSITLDARRFEPLRRQMLETPGGEALLSKAVAAQKDGVAKGIQEVFTGSMVAAACIFLICLTLREITLRRSFDAEHTPVNALPDAELV
jgi:EmrB/QacA subfamily drug resistance transporter